MIAIVESGSTKSDWVLLDGQNVSQHVETIGMNPYFIDADGISLALQEFPELLDLAQQIEAIHFYGAGCSSPDMNAIIEQALQSNFTEAEIKVKHDLAAAAYATYTGEAGICSILGTGSNSCFFDGEHLRTALPALSYVLGDEGSGAYFGKQLIRAFLYKQLPQTLSQRMGARYSFDKQYYLKQVYSMPRPNAFLASFMPFIFEWKEDENIQKMIKDGFTTFVDTQIKAFPEHKDVPLHFVGSVAYYFKSILEEVLNERELKLGQIVKRPLEGLMAYHTKAKHYYD